MTKELLLDMDGVLADFASSAIHALNKRYDKRITLDTFVREFGKWEMYDYYRISVQDFWDTINWTPRFWANIKPFPWSKQLYAELSKLGRVTILTAPSWDPMCSAMKLEWLQKHMGIKSDSVILGSRKELLAGNGILIDDFAANTNKFEAAGGKAILIPSTWNTPDLTFDQIMNVILKNISKIYAEEIDRTNSEPSRLRA
jgi:5'(3')-deoxyribonucleotidase